MIPFTIDLAGRVDSVATGRDGRLFLERGDGFDAQESFGAPFHDMARLERLWSIALERRQRLCCEVGATFVVLIAPEAHAVHADALPEPLSYATPSVGDRFRALAEGMGISVVWPRETLKAARGPVEVFRRDDSHWSAYGAFLGYRALMAALAPPLASGAIGADAVSFRWDEALGDLGWAAETPKPAPRLRPVFEAPRARMLVERSNERRQGLKITEVDDPSLPTALLFRDSFGAELSPFLAESFRRTTTIGAGERGYVEMILDERPDVVILQRSERALLSGIIDWGMETWREAFPSPGEDGAAASAELAARTALQLGDAETAVAEAERALVLEPTVERRIVAGRARLAAGQVAEAVEALQAAVGEAPGCWTALLHLGCARMAAGWLGEARDAFARACATAPWHPSGFEHYGYVSLLAGEPAGAIPALRTAVRLGPETPGAHLWLADALQQTGDLLGAVAALQAGLRVCPEDPLLQARFEALGRPLH